jgi:hypothetical protein
VQLLVDGRTAGTDYSAPYRFSIPHGGHVVEVRAVDAAGNFGAAVAAVGPRRTGVFAWRSPKSGPVTFRARGLLRRFTARRGVVYRLPAATLPLSWQG